MTRWVVDVDQEEFQKARFDLGMTQSDLAEKIHYSTSYISQVERGLRHPGPRFMYRVCQALNKPRESLFLTAEKSR
jgi:transcriptional regulator with XRE-family HTH domain